VDHFLTEDMSFGLFSSLYDKFMDIPAFSSSIIMVYYAWLLDYVRFSKADTPSNYFATFSLTLEGTSLESLFLEDCSCIGWNV